MAFTKKDVKDVAGLVAKKLEVYINDERKELNFDPSGRSYKRDKIMWQYDTFQRLFDHVTMDSLEKKQKTSIYKRRPNCQLVVDPIIKGDSLRSVQAWEVASIVEYANEIFKDHEVARLQEILAHKPSLRHREPPWGIEAPQSYTCHVGSCLKSDVYADFYKSNGLYCGSPRCASVGEETQALRQTRERDKKPQPQKANEEAQKGNDNDGNLNQVYASKEMSCEDELCVEAEVKTYTPPSNSTIPQSDSCTARAAFQNGKDRKPVKTQTDKREIAEAKTKREENEQSKEGKSGGCSTPHQYTKMKTPKDKERYQPNKTSLIKMLLAADTNAKLDTTGSSEKKDAEDNKEDDSLSEGNKYDLTFFKSIYDA